MQNYSIQGILDLAESKLSACQLEGPIGAFRTRPDSEAIANPAASAAAVNIHFMLGKLPRSPQQSEEWVHTLQGFQEEEGLFDQGSRALEITAACSSALQCFGRQARFPIQCADAQKGFPEMTSYMQELPWCGYPEKSARELAAVYSLLDLNLKGSSEWRQGVSDWIHSETDSHTGLLKQGCITPVELEGQWTLLPYLCAIFYPVALANYAHQPLCLPWRLIDTALEVMEFHRALFFKRRGHRHLPWVFCLNRSMRQTAHRHEEVRQVLIRFIPDYLSYLDRQIEAGYFESPRQIQWDLAALAELQLALPGRLQSDTPLRQVLDIHPFIM